LSGISGITISVEMILRLHPFGKMKTVQYENNDCPYSRVERNALFPDSAKKGGNSPSDKKG
jgi:hypothetical protein